MPVIPTTTEAVQIASTFNEPIATLIFSILFSLAGAALWIRRRLSRDSLEIKKDSAEGELIKYLEHERDVLKDDKEKLLDNILLIEKDRQEARSSVSGLSVEVEHLSKQVRILEKMVEDLSSELKKATVAMHELAIENAKLNEKIAFFEEMSNYRCYLCDCASTPINIKNTTGAQNGTE